MKKHTFSSLLLLTLAALLGACSGGASGEQEATSGTPVRLILDYLPNAIHTPFYSASDQHFYADKGLDVSILAPTSTSDTLRLMASGQAEFGLAPLIDVLKARADGEPVVILAGVVQTPLACVITTEGSGITRPKDFEGRMIGTSGIPGDEIIIRSMMINDHADPEKAKFMNIGYNLVPNLAAGRIDAIIGFWTQEAILFAAAGGKPVLVRMEDYGFPKFPEIALFCREDLVKEKPEMVRSFLAATAQGMDWSYAHEDAAMAGLASHVEGMNGAELKPFFDALKPVFKGEAPVWGWMDVDGIATYGQWATGMGLLDLSTPVPDFVSNDYLPQN